MMSNKRILPSIGLEGSKEELLEFLSDFEINKIAISFVGDRMVLVKKSGPKKFCHFVKR